MAKKQTLEQLQLAEQEDGRVGLVEKYRKEGNIITKSEVKIKVKGK